ncbi:MmcQ/YjbR family DNA-binding protein [Phenylobacterium sp. J367]|uniref:MmcQ/YjbR family DNA-binding protein n=1 Tax=Phenylobacterium sp. J367 TaxID=2898435 RepID=UPI0027E37B86|nr:MmcQ/YjbR family DNA-binding protein [Phenylobacterium sp. J367]
MTRDELHAAALALPGAHMDVQWGDDHVYKVAGKMFAATDGACSNLSFKATDIAFEALTGSGRARPAPLSGAGQVGVLRRPRRARRGRGQGLARDVPRPGRRQADPGPEEGAGAELMPGRAEVEAIALALPATTKVVQWGGSDVYKVGGKVFAICGDESLSFKVSEIGFVVLTEDGGPGRQAPLLRQGPVGERRPGRRRR